MYHTRCEIAPVFVKILVMSLVLELCWACWGSKIKGPVTSHKIYGNKKNPTEVEKIINSAWGGFTVPKNVSDTWLAWLKKYNEYKMMKENSNGTSFNESDDDALGNVPHDWKGMGPGIEGFPPMDIPPWGYKAKNTGLPPFCYLAPDKGKCDAPTKGSPSKRWVYNPYLEDCQEFDYSGCRGNKNNFIEKLKCVAACTNPGATAEGCNLETDARFEDGLVIDEEVSKEFLNRRSATSRCSLKQPKI